MEQKLVNVHELIYIVQADGRMYNPRRESKEIAQRLNRDGYLSFTAGKKDNRKRVSTHRVIAQAFVPNPHNYSQVDHVDGNNTIVKLETG